MVVRRPRHRKDPGCLPEYDTAVECLKRMGGIRPDETIARDLIHSAGGARFVPVGLLNKTGMREGQVAAALMQRGYGTPDQDDRDVLNELAETIRSRRPWYSTRALWSIEGRQMAPTIRKGRK